jgi:hypothetical protein
MKRQIPFSILILITVCGFFLTNPVHATDINSDFDHAVTDTNDVILVSECMEIIRSGTYQLESDISGDDTCLVIKASYVTLDGNGYSVIGEENGWGIHVDGSEQLLSNIEIRNIIVDGWANGLFASNFDNSRITGVTARNNTSSGLRLGNISDSVVDSIHTSNNRNGIWFGSTTQDNQVTHITSRDNSHFGIYISGSYGNLFEQLTSVNNHEGVYVIAANNNIIREVLADSNRFYGIDLRASSRNNRYEQITSSNNRWHGMRIGESEHNEFDDVFLYANEMSGIFLVGDLRFNTRVTGNSFRNITATQNQESGVSISVAAFNEFDGIMLNDNGQNGITLGSRNHDNTFRNVAINGTGHHGISALNNSPDNSFHNITISDAGSASFYYSVQFGDDSPRNELRNVVINSGRNGISVRTDSTVVDSLAVSGVTGTAVQIWQGAVGSSLSNLFLSDNSLDFRSSGQSNGNSVEYMVLDGGAVSFDARDVTITHNDPPENLPGGLGQLPYFVEIRGSGISGDNPHVEHIRFYYDPEKLDGWDESTLEIWRYDSENGWTHPGDNSYTTGVNTEENYVYAENITEFSIFAVLSSELPTSVTELEELPDAFVLAQNYPNPFNPSTSIRYELPETARVRLEVFNLLGERVATLVDERREAGRHQVSFDAGSLASGVYLYRLQAGDFVQTRKLTLIR